jgi:hypothetical protein
VIEDLVAYGVQLFFSDEGGADRASAYRRFTSNFEPGSTIEIAEKTDRLLSQRARKVRLSGLPRT